MILEIEIPGGGGKGEMLCFTTVMGCWSWEFHGDAGIGTSALVVDLAGLVGGEFVEMRTHWKFGFDAVGGERWEFGILTGHPRGLRCCEGDGAGSHTSSYRIAQARTHHRRNSISQQEIKTECFGLSY
jgi:hypothetical protein